MEKLTVTLEDRPVDIELAQYKRMFEAACSALAAIGDALGVDPEEGGAEPILAAIADLKASDSRPVKQEPFVRFCPGCGSVGDVDAKYRDCCPDGIKARVIPKELADDCRGLFLLALENAAPISVEAAVLAEREACAKLCESTYEPYPTFQPDRLPCFDTPADCAAAIRGLSTNLCQNSTKLVETPRIHRAGSFGSD